MKVHLVPELNQDTLSHLEAYITMWGGDEMACLETIQDRLCRILYIWMLLYLKLVELAKPMGFASMITVGKGATVQGNKHHIKRKGKKRDAVAAVSTGAGVHLICP